MSSRLNVGIIGAGAMGASHAHTLAASVPGAKVAMVFDMDSKRAKMLASDVEADVADSPDEIFSECDAILIASPDETHADLAATGVALAKPVFCEKPLAATPEDAGRVVDAEVSHGRRVIQMGFNRRFDPGFISLKSSIVGGTVGQVRLVHALHRNASNTTSVDDSSLITGSMIHEFDTLRWLLDDEVEAIRVESPVREGFRDPQLATLWMRGGQMVTAEVFVNAGYGYDVRVEVVGSGGAALLEPRGPVVSRVNGSTSSVVGADGFAHFVESYRRELAAWVAAAAADETVGASAWDGYVANLVADAGLRSLRSGGQERVAVPARPALYGGGS